WSDGVGAWGGALTPRDLAWGLASAGLRGLVTTAAMWTAFDALNGRGPRDLPLWSFIEGTAAIVLGIMVVLWRWLPSSWAANRRAAKAGRSPRAFVVFCRPRLQKAWVVTALLGIGVAYYWPVVLFSAWVNPATLLLYPVLL